MKVYLVAGEPSGDKLGAALMAELKNSATFDLDYSGVGGPLMEDQGLASLFPIDDIAVIGVGEILAKYNFLKERINNTCLLYTSPSPRDKRQSRMPSSA